MSVVSFRFRIRTLILFVSASAAALGGERLLHRRNLCLVRAAQHARSADQFRDEADGLLCVFPGDLETEKAYLRRVAHHHSCVAERYRFLASHPWLSVEPEPPPD